MTLVDRVPVNRVVLLVFTFALVLVVWWAATALGSIPPFVLPPPTAVVDRLIGRPHLYLESATATLAKVFVGGGLGIGIGLALALAMWTVPLFRRTIYPYLVAIRVLPKVAIAPVLLLYFGLGFDTAVMFVAAASFFPMVVSTTAGFERVPKRQRDLLRSVDAGPVRTTLAVDLPYALPDVFAGVKQSVTLAVVGAVIAEWVVSTEGLGYLVLIGSESVQPSIMLAALSVLIAMGVSLYAAVVALQRWLSWTPETRH
jgi:NitT/TauT family transport system permease protein